MLSRHIVKRYNFPRLQSLRLRLPNPIQFRFYCQKPYTKEMLYNSIVSLKEDIQKTSYVSELNEIISNVVQEMERKKVNTMKIKITFGVIVLIILLALYDVITSWMSGQVNIITEKSLDDDELKRKIVEVCHETINELVKSPQIQNDVALLLKTVVVDLTKDEELQNSVAGLLKTSVIDLTHNEEIKENVIELAVPIIIDLTKRPDIEENIRKLLLTAIENISKDENVHAQCGKLVKAAVYNATFGE